MSPLIILYIVTGTLSIAIAVLLVHFSRLSSQASGRTGRLKGTTSALTDKALKRSLAEEINESLTFSPRRDEAKKRLEEVFSKELEKRIDLANQIISKKYEAVVEQNKQSEEIAWKKYKKVLVEKKETEAVIRSIAEGLIVVGSKGQIVMMNPAAEKLLGVSQKDKVGKPILENLKDEQLVSLSKTTPGKEDKEIELVSSHDETKKVLRASNAIIENENGLTVGMVSILSDVTKQKELDRLKSDFVSNVTHELRTPLVAIDKSIALLINKETGPINETQEKFLAIADRNIKRLSTLINDLLDLSKLEAGKMELRFEPTTADKMINDCLESLDTWAKTKSIRLEKKVHEGIPEIKVDANRIHQVLVNLVGNAIKFTPQNGSVTVEAVLRKENEEIEVSVKDTGIGMSKEDLPRIFDKFYQAAERASTDISGTGIGLSVARELVALHGGKIWAESEKGNGAKFTFTLPLRK